MDARKHHKAHVVVSRDGRAHTVYDLLRVINGDILKDQADRFLYVSNT